MKVLLSLGYPDVKESIVGFAAIIKILGWGSGFKAILFATGKHMADMWRGGGNYPEKGKRRIWFKLNYVKRLYDYLKMRNEPDWLDQFAAILIEPSLRFIGNVIPPAHELSKEIVLHKVWPDLIKQDYNVVAEACPPGEHSATMHVSRCFFNEVARDVGLTPVADKICHADFVFWEHYHPNIIFSRTKTLIAGDNLCDHTLNWRE